jgi:hypothetical protein
MNSKDLAQAAVAKKMLECVIINSNRVKTKKILIDMFKDENLLKDCKLLYLFMLCYVKAYLVMDTCIEISNNDNLGDILEIFPAIFSEVS